MTRSAWSALALIGCGCKVEEPEPPPADPCVVGEPGVLCTMVGTGEQGNNGTDLRPLETFLYLPSALAFDPDGRLLVDDFNNNWIRRLDDDGVLRSIAGVGVHGFALHDSAGVESMLENPIDIAVDPADGTLYISELHGGRVLKVDPEGWLTAYVGSPTEPGYFGYSGDGGPAQEALISEGQFGHGLAVLPDGTLLTADTDNHCIRGVTKGDEIIDTLFGDGSPGFVDGVGTEARFHTPQALALDGDVLYITDSGNHAVRRVDLGTGEVTTVAGTGVAGFSGDGGPAVEAQMAQPSGITVGPEGELYVAEWLNHVIRRIGVDGIIDTVAGTPTEFGFAGDGGPPEEALLSRPADVAIGPNGDMVIADQFNNRIRVIRGFLAE